MRGENKEAVVRIETGHVPPDEVRTVVGVGGGRWRGASALQDICHSRVVSGGWVEMVTSTPLDLQRSCIRDAAVNI